MDAVDNPNSTTFVPVEGVAELDALFTRSARETVVLYQHDPWCPISRRALHEMQQLGGAVAIVDVARQRDVSREIQARSGVRHESPQVIVLRDGQPVWNASHLSITRERVHQAREFASNTTS